MRRSSSDSPQKIKQFVDKEVDYYQYVFNEFEQGHRRIVINFSVLFLGSLWFFYRKMHVLGAVLLLYPFVLFGLMVVLESHYFLSFLLIFFVLVRVVVTCFGNRLYWYKWNAFVESRKPSRGMLRGGGVNVIVPILVAGFLFCFSYWVLSGMMQGMRHS